MHVTRGKMRREGDIEMGDARLYSEMFMGTMTAYLTMI